MKTRYTKLMTIYGKIQVSGLIGVIPLICILTIKDQCHVFLHPESLKVNPVEACVCLCSGSWLNGHNSLCLLIWQGTFLVTGCYNKLPRVGSLNNIYSLPHSSGGWKWKTQGTGSVDSSWGLSGKDLLLTFLSSWQMTIFSPCLFPSSSLSAHLSNFPLIKTRSYWTRACPYDLIVTWLPLWRPSVLIGSISNSWGLGVQYTILGP